MAQAAIFHFTAYISHIPNILNAGALNKLTRYIIALFSAERDLNTARSRTSVYNIIASADDVLKLATVVFNLLNACKSQRKSICCLC